MGVKAHVRGCVQLVAPGVANSHVAQHATGSVWVVAKIVVVALRGIQLIPQQPYQIL